ncbi:hypothetical protein M441DRAFT_127123 [Trichoderma asperellum CBS 433.97]|uniref:Uncharacterized protein n=1 Tax=Trichoderma asperellum (strain ATCC 204424 / CBS 433.97 / NBRC 101777) TaxID=1042311 RepID=A0A2T3ZQB5_TRIA4|nr:hypothetical protein M441DRAFT_127123 [Trichoderma asperellum CBS 433.97]PTB47000.1 hypothetical protein M441DRAFT_127123 [Trichoderma asperellum CBS 433.97]
MEELSSQPNSPASAGGPLQMASPDRVNQRRDIFASVRPVAGEGGRDSTVHDKISQFNSLSMSMQSRQLERKSADAALKRAMLGREEAEAEMKRLKEEARALRQEIEEGKERERRVGERLETIMENYGRAKETHAHTEALWEKEIRRARKENFKAQSTIVKLQEDLKNTRAATKLTAQESLLKEKEKTRAQEHEIFEAKYQVSNLQDQLEQAFERMKLVEQERDAYKTAAKNEEVARLAAEGRIPLPAEESDNEFASPPRKRRIGSTIRCRDPRVSLSTMEVVSSASLELELEELSEQVQWERQRADRAQEMIEFMQAECQMHCCPASKSKRRTSMLAMQLPRASPQKSRLSLEATIQEEKSAPAEHVPSPVQQHELKPGKVRKGARRSTVFLPKEGVFRTVSEQEAIELEAQRKAEIVIEAHEETEPELSPPKGKQEAHQRTFARTPSVEPSAYDFAPSRASLMSLIDTPRINAQADSLPNLHSIPTVSDNNPAQEGLKRYLAAKRPSAGSSRSSSTAVYTVTTTVPLQDERSSSSTFSQRMRTASSSSSASFDTTDPAMDPTMTREEALAKIQERRGRARSVTRGAATSQSRPTSGMGRRDVSRMGRVGSRSRSRNS